MPCAIDAGAKKALMQMNRRHGIYGVMFAKSKSWKSSRSLINAEHYDMVSPNTPTYVNIKAPPSVLPPKK